MLQIPFDRRSARARVSAVAFALLALAPVAGAAAGERETSYEEPPREIVDIVDAPITPRLRTDPNREWLLIAERPPLRTIEDLAEPQERLAGMRFNPQNRGPDRPSYVVDLALARVADALDEPIDDIAAAEAVEGLPDDPRLRNLRWAPDGERAAFIHVEADRVGLWILDAEERRAREVPDLDVNATLPGQPFHWAPGGDHLWVRSVPEDPGDKPERSAIPSGASVRETRGEPAPARTYQDLLESDYDAALFDHYATGQLVRVDLELETQPVGEPGIQLGFRPAPDGEHWLVTEIDRPYSYALPYSRFPRTIDVWDAEGEKLFRLADRPLADDIPVAFDATVTGPRHAQWRPDRGAELVWVEAQDGGDPESEAWIRDRVYAQRAPFEDEPRVLANLATRYRSIRFGDDETALVTERWWDSRREVLWRVAPDQPGAEKRKLWDRNWEDRYRDPGRPLTRPDERGFSRLVLQDGAILLSGDGASEEGDRPFLDRLDLTTGETERLWRSEPPDYERAIAAVDGGATSVITRREREDEPPNLYLRDLDIKETTPLTAFPHPMPDLRDVSRELITYEREDGVSLSARLLLPPGYDPEEDDPLPTLIWAYPREFRSADAAGQVRGSPHEFNRIRYWRPQYLVTQGYAVLDRATMPVVGEGKEEPNDTFVDQLAMNARAAIDAGVERGVTDPDRVAVGGHSYGAFMAANLLAHTDLFRAGIARSGAYNRSLTPFGFQREQRTLFEAPEVYIGMSPFFHADQIDAPLLLIHGREDNNSGTYPMQSERLYSALDGLGKTARLVMLPEESHGYRARESILHMLDEQLAWLNEFLRGEARSGVSAR